MGIINKHTKSTRKGCFYFAIKTAACQPSGQASGQVRPQTDPKGGGRGEGRNVKQEQEIKCEIDTGDRK